MNRPFEPFAVAAIALLAAGLLFPRVSILSSVLVSIYTRNMTYAVRPETALFGIAALFSLFAFVYSVWMAGMNRTAAEWHFWLSAIAIVLFASGFIAVGTMPRTAGGASFGPVRAVAILGTFGGLLVFIAGQIVFLTNLILVATRTSRTT